MKKSECTPEQWEAYKARQMEYYYANREKIRERRKQHWSKPDVKAKRASRDALPEVREKRRARDKKSRPKQYAKVRNDPERWSKVIAGQRKRRTGMSKGDIDALLAKQDWKCAVCFRDFEGRQIRADHCHDSGQPRGLLCHHCNIIEGMIRSMGIAPEDFGRRLSHYLCTPPFKSV